MNLVMIATIIRITLFGCVIPGKVAAYSGDRIVALVEANGTKFKTVDGKLTPGQRSIVTKALKQARTN